MAAKANSKANGYTFHWKIENVFNWWWLKKAEGIESPVFIADGLENTKWTLWFYPIIEKYESYVGFYFQRDDCEGPEVVEVFYQFALLAEDGSILKEKSALKKRFSKSDNWGFLSFEERVRVFVFERKEFFPEDTLKVQCSVWIADQKPAHLHQLFATSCIKVKRRSFVWRINEPKILEADLRNKRRDYLITCNLLLHKNLDNLRIILSCLDDNIRYISSNISITDAEGKKENCGIQKYFTRDLSDEPLTFTVGLLSKHLMQNEAKYFPNDVLSFDFEFVILTIENNTTQLQNVIVGNEKFQNTSTLIDDLYSLFSDAILSDTEIHTTNTIFLAHRNILSIRSPVFSRMFSQDMREKKSGVVQILDYDDDTVYRMLMYIYTGLQKDLQLESAVNLYRIADKYQILPLRNYCSFFFRKNLSLTNVYDILILADLYTDDGLKNYVQNYILRQGKQIFYSQEWKDFMKNCVKLAAEILLLKVTKSRRNLSSDA